MTAGISTAGIHGLPLPPGLPRTELPTGSDIDQVLAYRDIGSFTRNLEDWHNRVHVWVGGHMSDIPVAAYDPAFRAHHAMIDRVWRLWQLRCHGGCFGDEGHCDVPEARDPFDFGPPHPLAPRSRWST